MKNVYFVKHCVINESLTSLKLPVIRYYQLLLTHVDKIRQIVVFDRNKVYTHWRTSVGVSQFSPTH